MTNELKKTTEAMMLLTQTLIEYKCLTGLSETQIRKIGDLIINVAETTQEEFWENLTKNLSRSKK